MTFDLALITGASSGLGKELARLLARKNIPLIISGRNKDELQKLQHELSTLSEITCCTADISDRKELEHLQQVIKEKKPSLLINCAGLGLYGEAISHSVQEQMEMIDVNVSALTALTLQAAQVLQQEKKEGVIMNISSAAAFFIYPSFAIYSASKAFVNHFSLSLDIELQKYGIRVLTCCPGQINTPFRKKASHGLDSSTKDFRTIETQKAAALVYQQIISRRKIRIIDFRYKILVFISTYIIPKAVVLKILQSQIEKRIKRG
jgi:short-subunit dehydrogenase